MATLGQNAESTLGQDFKAAAVTKDTGTSSTELVAAAAAAGRYRIVNVGDYTIYVQQGGTAVIATSHAIPPGVIDYCDKEAGKAINAIAATASSTNVGLQKA